MTFTSSALLDRKIENIMLPYRKIPSVRLKEVENILQENPRPPRLETGEVDPRWFRSASTCSIELCREHEPDFLYEKSFSSRRPSHRWIAGGTLC